LERSQFLPPGLIDAACLDFGQPPCKAVLIDAQRLPPSPLGWEFDIGQGQGCILPPRSKGSVSDKRKPGAWRPMSGKISFFMTAIGGPLRGNHEV